MCDEEEWRDIDIYPQYQISSLGNVVRKKDGVILKQYPQKNGYVYVVLDRGRGRHYVPVHRLVCYAFHGSEGYAKGLFVDHINTIRSDNRASNLRWVTPFENANNETTKLNRRKNRKENKVMTQEDKIYFNIHTALYHNERQTEDDIVYIRTDDFIEKACDWLKENKDKYLYNTGERGEYIPTCSGKMIDEFRNYMKGE